jgi:hypothetical protein
MARRAKISKTYKGRRIGTLPTPKNFKIESVDKQKRGVTVIFKKKKR